MRPVEKVCEVTQIMLSLDEIRLCFEIGKLVESIPDEKIRFLKIERLWETYIPAHSEDRNWTGNAKTDIALNYLLWVRVLQAQGCNADELFAMIQNYIKQTDVSPRALLLLPSTFKEFQDYFKQISIPPSPFHFLQTRVRLLIGQRQLAYKGYIYKINGEYSFAQAQLLVQEAFDRERRYWERLERKFGRGEEHSQDERPRIPESVRIEVWRRDGGKCARCGSRENLEYDHIVPVSRGGSNTSRNIELLCEKCNRQKGANIQ